MVRERSPPGAGALKILFEVTAMAKRIAGSQRTSTAKDPDPTPAIRDTDTQEKQPVDKTGTAAETAPAFGAVYPATSR